MVSARDIQKALGISLSTAQFIVERNEIPAIAEFPPGTSREDLLKIVMESEECDEETANQIVDIGQGKWWDDESRDVQKGRYSGWISRMGTLKKE